MRQRTAACARATAGAARVAAAAAPRSGGGRSCGLLQPGPDGVEVVDRPVAVADAQPVGGGDARQPGLGLAHRLRQRPAAGQQGRDRREIVQPVPWVFEVATRRPSSQ